MIENHLKDIIYKLGLYNFSKRYLIKPYNLFKNIGFKLNSKKTLEHFLSNVEGKQFNYWLEFGTLLGAIRENGLIPHDNDIDIAVDSNEQKNIYHFMINIGFKLVKRAKLQTGNVIEETYKYKTAHIDIFYSFRSQDKVIIYDYQTFDNLSPNECMKRFGGLRVHKNIFSYFDTTDYSFLRYKAKIPDNPDLHLTELYGKNYIIPDKNWSLSSRPVRYKTDFLAKVIFY